MAAYLLQFNIQMSIFVLKIEDPLDKYLRCQIESENEIGILTIFCTLALAFRTLNFFRGVPYRCIEKVP